jgi:hypothetical protein
MRLVNTIAAIRACGVLHNMSRMFEDPVPEDEEEEDMEEGDGGEDAGAEAEQVDGEDAGEEAEQVDGEDAGEEAEQVDGGAAAAAINGRLAGEGHRDYLLSTYNVWWVLFI